MTLTLPPSMATVVPTARHQLSGGSPEDEVEDQVFDHSTCPTDFMSPVSAWAVTSNSTLVGTPVLANNANAAVGELCRHIAYSSSHQ
jgi:hypothetical protein